MKLSDFFNVNKNKQTINIIASRFGVGKTTLLVIVGSEFVLDGKRVLYLTGDNTTKYIVDKFSKNFGITNNNIESFKLKYANKLVSKHIIHGSSVNKIKNTISTIHEKFKFDLLLIDDAVTLDFDLLKDLSTTFDCTIFQTCQSKYDIVNLKEKPIESIKSAQVADMAVSFTIKKTTFWENVKYFFLFWKTKPNRTLKIIKNRYGKDGTSTDVFIDFQNNKIKL